LEEGRFGPGGAGAPGEHALPGMPRGGYAGGGGAFEEQVPRRFGGGEAGRGTAGEPLDARLGAPNESALRAGTGAFGSGQFGAERAGPGTGPWGGGLGARRTDDEDERPMPDYLVESSDSWAGEQSASPAVIGE
jgi:hypothetical protein